MTEQDIRERLEDMARRSNQLRGHSDQEMRQARERFDEVSDSLREIFEAVHHGVAHADTGEEAVRAEVDGYGTLRHLEISPRAMHDMDCRALSMHCGHAINAAREQLATALDECAQQFAGDAAQPPAITAADIGSAFDIAKEIAWRG